IGFTIEPPRPPKSAPHLNPQGGHSASFLILETHHDSDCQSQLVESQPCCPDRAVRNRREQEAAGCPLPGAAVRSRNQGRSAAQAECAESLDRRDRSDCWAIARWPHQLKWPRPRAVCTSS